MIIDRKNHVVRCVACDGEIYEAEIEHKQQLPNAILVVCKCESCGAVYKAIVDPYEFNMEK